MPDFEMRKSINTNRPIVLDAFKSFTPKDTFSRKFLYRHCAKLSTFYTKENRQ